MIMQMPGMPEPEPKVTNAAILSAGWDFLRMLGKIETKHVKVVIEQGKPLQIDANNLRGLELLHATLEMFDTTGLRKECEARSKFFMTEWPIEEEPKK